MICFIEQMCHNDIHMNGRVRKDIRLNKFDYSQPYYYFVTICVKDKHPILSKVVTEEIVGVDRWATRVNLLPLGGIIENNINYINKSFNDRKIDSYIIMPNHIHLIIQILHNGSPNGRPLHGQIISSFKQACHKQAGYKFFQRNYYEHIIRNETSLNEIRQYIQNNPINWLTDNYYVSP